jgi:hypothetical protein
MPFGDTAGQRPTSIRGEVRLPRREQYLTSRRSWRDEVLYFLLVDRFSDGREGQRPALDPTNRSAARPSINGGGMAMAAVAAAGPGTLAGRHAQRCDEPAGIPRGPRRHGNLAGARCSSSVSISTRTTARASRTPRRRPTVRNAPRPRGSGEGGPRPPNARHPRRHLQPLGLEVGVPGWRA